MKRKMKALIAVLLSVLLFFTMTVTAFADEAGTSNPGGWTVAPVGGSIPDDVSAALADALGINVGMDVVPVAYFATQVVSGTNYAILCEKTSVVQNPVLKLALYKVHVALDGTTNLIGESEDFNIEDYDQDGANLILQTGKAGGWQIPEDYSRLDSVNLPQELATLVSAIENEALLGASYEPMAYLGSQVVKGTRYAFLCHETMATEEAGSSIAVVTLVQEPDGLIALDTVCTIMGIPEETSEEDPGAITGGWTIEAMGGYVPLEMEKALKKASEGTVGTVLSPIAYMEKQIVNGVNYKVLCTSTPVVENPETKLVVAVVNVASDGQTSMTLEDFNIADYAEDGGVEVIEAGNGTWIIPEDHTVISGPFPEEVASAMSVAEQPGVAGGTSEVMAYLGRQIVNGTNYAFLVHRTLTTNPAVSELLVVTVNEDTDFNFTFRSAYRLYGVTEPAAEPTYHFTDVPDDEWFTEAIYALAEAGVMTGYEGHTVFGTYDNLSRAQFVTILYRIAGEPDVTTSGSFADVPAGKWYSKAVEWAKENGLITGYENTNRFGPADPITREQIWTIYWRANGSPVVDQALNYKDAASVSPWALDAARWAVSTGMIKGKEEQTVLDPQGLTKRCECAETTYRYLKLIDA